jgi:uncharacterized protein (DUF305 family)
MCRSGRYDTRKNALVKMGRRGARRHRLTPGLVVAQHAQPGAMKGVAMKSAMSPAGKAFTASMQTMMKDMKVKPTGDQDTDFIRMMMPHHQGAIDMTRNCGNWRWTSLRRKARRLPK